MKTILCNKVKTKIFEIRLDDFHFGQENKNACSKKINKSYIQNPIFMSKYF